MKIMIDIDTTSPARRQILATIASRYDLDAIDYSDADRRDESTAFTKRGDLMVQDAEREDIAVTDDYDIANELIGKTLAVVSPEGFVYSSANMNELFYRRFRKKREAIRIKAGKAKPRKLTERAAARKEREEEQAFTSLILDFIAPINA